MSFNNLTGLAASRALDTTVKSFHIDYNVKNMANNIVMTLYGDVWLLEAFPGDSVVKNLPANAGDTGSIPGPGKSHMLWGNLSLCVATTTEPVL